MSRESESVHSLHPSAPGPLHTPAPQPPLLGMFPRHHIMEVSHPVFGPA